MVYNIHPKIIEIYRVSFAANLLYIQLRKYEICCTLFNLLTFYLIIIEPYIFWVKIINLDSHSLELTT